MEENIILKELLKLAFGKTNRPIVLSQTILRYCLIQKLIKLGEDDCYVLTEKGKQFIAD